MKRENLTKGELFIVDWQYDLCGDFKRNLAMAIARADWENRNKLSLGFPEEVLAMYNFQNEAGWWEEVQERAEI